MSPKLFYFSDRLLELLYLPFDIHADTELPPFRLTSERCCLINWKMIVISAATMCSRLSYVILECIDDFILPLMELHCRLLEDFRAQGGM